MGTPELTTWAPAARTTSINSNVTITNRPARYRTTTSYPRYRMELRHRCGVSTSTTDSREAIESMFHYIDGHNGTATETGKISFQIWRGWSKRRTKTYLPNSSTRYCMR